LPYVSPSTCTSTWRAAVRHFSTYSDPSPKAAPASRSACSKTACSSAASRAIRIPRPPPPAAALAAEPSLTVKASAAVRDHGGVILRALGETLAVSPPLTISLDEIRLIHDGLRAGLDALVESGVPA
jgi:hypothetical protein